MDGNASSRRTSLSSGLDTSAIGSDVLVSLSVPSSAMDEQRGIDDHSEPAVRSSRSAIERAYTEALAILEIDEKPSSSLDAGSSAAQLLLQARMKGTNMPSSATPASTSTNAAPTHPPPGRPETGPMLEQPSSETHAHAGSNGSCGTDVPSSEGNQMSSAPPVLPATLPVPPHAEHEQGQGGQRVQTLRELAVAAGYSSTADPSDAAAVGAHPSARSAGAILRRGHAGLASTGSLAIGGGGGTASAGGAVAGGGQGQGLGYGLRLSRSFSAPVEFTTAHRALPSAPPSERPLDTAIAVPVPTPSGGPPQPGAPPLALSLAASASAPPAPISSRHMGGSSLGYAVGDSHPPAPVLTPQPVPTAPPPATATTTPTAEPPPLTLQQVQVQHVEQAPAEVSLQRSEPVRQVDKPRGRSSAVPVLQAPMLNVPGGGGTHAAPAAAHGPSWGASAVALAPPVLPALHESAGQGSRQERPPATGSAGPSTATAAVGGRRQSAGPALPHFPAPALPSLGRVVAGGTAARTLQPPSLAVSAMAHGLVGAAVVAIQHPQPLPVTYALLPLRGASAGEDDGEVSRKKADRLSLLPANAPLPPPMLAQAGSMAGRAGSPHKARVSSPALPPQVVAPQPAAAAGPPPAPAIPGAQRSGAMAVAVPLLRHPPLSHSIPEPQQQQQELLQGPPTRLPMARQGREPHAGGVHHWAARGAPQGDASSAVPHSVRLPPATRSIPAPPPAPPPPPSAPAVSHFGGHQAGAQAVSVGVGSLPSPPGREDATPPSASSSSSLSAPPSPVQSALLQHLRESIALTESLLSPSTHHSALVPAPVPVPPSTLPTEATEDKGGAGGEEEEAEVEPPEPTVSVPSSLLQSLLTGGGEAEERLARLLLARAGHTPARVAAGGKGRSAGMAGLASPEGPIEVSSLLEQLQKIAAESHTSTSSATVPGTASTTLPSSSSSPAAAARGTDTGTGEGVSYSRPNGHPDDMQVSPMRQSSPAGGESEAEGPGRGMGLDGPADPIPDFEQALAALSTAEATVARALQGALSQGGKSVRSSGSGPSVQEPKHEHRQSKARPSTTTTAVPLPGTTTRGVPLHTATRAYTRHQAQGPGAGATISSSAAAAAVRATAQPRPTSHATESPPASSPAPSTATGSLSRVTPAPAHGRINSRAAAAPSTQRRRHSDVRGSTGQPYTSLSQTAAESHMMMQFAEALQVLLDSPTAPAPAAHAGRTTSSTVRSTSPRSGAPITITTTTVDPSALLPLVPPSGYGSGGPIRGLQALSPPATRTTTRRSPSPVRAHRLSPRSVQGQDMGGAGAWAGEETLPVLQLTPQGPVYRSPPKKQQHAQPQPTAPDSTRKLATALESLLGLGLPLESMMAVVAAAVGSKGGGEQQAGEALDVDAVTGHSSASGAWHAQGSGSASDVPPSSSSSARPVVTFTKHVQAALSAQQRDPHAWRAAVVVAPLKSARGGAGYVTRGRGEERALEHELYALSASQQLSHSRGPHRGQALQYFEQALARAAVSTGTGAEEKQGDDSSSLSASSGTGLSHLTPLRAKYVIPPFPR